MSYDEMLVKDAVVLYGEIRTAIYISGAFPSEYTGAVKDEFYKAILQ
jgi:hypothetical protein